MNQVVARPSNLSNTSSNDDSINDFSLFGSFNSSISTKFSLYRNHSNPQAFGSAYISEFEDSSPKLQQQLPKMGAVSRSNSRSNNQQGKKQSATATTTTDRLSVTLHTSDSDFTKTRRRRPEFNRQKSISRWMADTLSNTSQILRAVSSHERILSLSRRSMHNGDHDKDRPPLKKNASFRFFQRTDFQMANSTRSILKPVRRPSSGPEGIVNHVLASLKVTDSTHSTARVGTSGFLDGDDIEDSETDNEEEEFGGSTDFELNSVEFTPTTEFTKTQPPLLSDSKRWDASSPTRKEDQARGTDSSPGNAKGSIFNSDSRRSSRAMPVPPPPPFTPIKKPSGKLSGDEVLNTALAPLAAAAIATDGMGEEIEEEMGVLNDLAAADDSEDNIPKHSTVNNRSDHTDDATASSDDYTCNDSISTDGVSLLSASTFNTIPNWTNRSNSSLGLGYALERLNEEDSRQSKSGGGGKGGPYSNKDFSNKSGTDDTCESAYSFHHDANDSSVDEKQQQQLTPLPEKRKAASEHTRGLEPLLEPPLTPLRDASIVPPAMPRRSLSNHNDNSDHNDHDVPIASPADRLKYLLHHNENRCGRRSSMPSGAANSRWDNGSDHSNSMTVRRASLDNSTHHSRRSRLTRRGSLDSSSSYSRLASMRRASIDNNSSRSRSRRNSIPYPPSLDDSEHLSPESRNKTRVNNHQGLLTPTMSRTTRASPGMGANRKRMNPHTAAAAL